MGKWEEKPPHCDDPYCPGYRLGYLRHNGYALVNDQMRGEQGHDLRAMSADIRSKRKPPAVGRRNIAAIMRQQNMEEAALAAVRRDRAGVEAIPRRAMREDTARRIEAVQATTEAQEELPF